MFGHPTPDINNFNAVYSNRLFVENMASGDHSGLQFSVDGLISQPRFSSNSKELYFMEGRDSLGVMELKTGAVKYLAGIKSFQISENRAYICYLTNESRLRLENTESHKSIIYSSAVNYEFSGNGQTLLVQSEEKIKDKFHYSLLWVDLNSLSSTTIWTGESAISSWVFDPYCRRVAFIALDNDADLNSNVLYIYKVGLKKANRLVNERSSGIEKDFAIEDGQLQFNRNGSKILFTTKEKPPTEGIIQASKIDIDVNVWNYKNQFNPVDQLRYSDKILMLTVDVDSKKIITLNKKDEHVVKPQTKYWGGPYLLVSKNLSMADYYKSFPANYIVSTEDGSRTLVSNKALAKNGGELSPDNRFFVWFDYSVDRYFSLEISSGETNNISNNIPCDLADTSCSRYSDRIPQCYGICGWQPSTKSVFINDKYDIWKIDLQGKRAPINLTNGFGRKN
ncbi:MAG: hypothetical protein JST32_10900, partial [Bacteroidetes bacterium]|nr:hypothetical protein [Bacteroidota bacterium]